MTGVASAPLGEVATIERVGVDPSKLSEDRLYVGLENIESSGDLVGVRAVGNGELASTKFAFEPSHVLFGKLRPYLSKIARPSFSGICSTDILPIQPGPTLDRGYLFHFLRQPDNVRLASSLATGVNLPRLSPAALEGFIVPLPPLADQRRIAAILDQADALRAKRRAVLERLDSLIQAIFLQMFGHPASTQQRFASRPLISLCERITVGWVGPMTDEYVTTGVPFLRSLNIRRGRIDLSDVKFVSTAFHRRISKSALHPGDVVTVRTGQPGTTAVVPNTIPEANCADLIVFTCSEELEPDYLCEALNLWLGDAESIQGQVGAIQTHFNIGRARELLLPHPPIQEQRRFATRKGKLNQVKWSMEASLAKFDSLFASIQHRAFRGGL